MPYTFPNIPTWRLKQSSICNNDDLYPTKRMATDRELRNIFHHHKLSHHSREFHIYTDGSKDEENVGCAAVGIGREITRKLHPASSIFTAELWAIYCAIDIIKTSTFSSFVVFVDSRSVLETISQFNKTHPIVTMIIQDVVELEESGKSLTFCWCPAHVGIMGNEKADEQAKRAATMELPIYIDAVPFKDYYPIIKRSLKLHCKEQWTNIEPERNKLREIKELD